MKKTRLLAAACAVAFTLNHNSHAQLFEWDMSGVDQSTATLAASTAEANISLAGSSGQLARGVGAALPGSTGSNNFGASGFDSAALSAEEYFTFSVAAGDGRGLKFKVQVEVKVSVGQPG